MKPINLLAIMLCCTAPASALTIDDINPESARFYQAHIVTFLWPDQFTSESIKFENLDEFKVVPRFESESEQDQIETNTSGDAPALAEEGASEDETKTSLVQPDSVAQFEQFTERLEKKAQVLYHHSETLLFQQSGDVHYLTFHSEPSYDGYAELTGTGSITFGRYLQTDLNYTHYQFDSYTVPAASLITTNTDAVNSTNAAEVSEIAELIEIQPQATIKQFEPALTLNVKVSNRTASGKLNYIDHPVIGTLVYFEPLEIEQGLELMNQALEEESPNSKLNISTPPVITPRL